MQTSLKSSLVCAWLATALSLHAATHTVSIFDFGFTPSPLTIDVGDTVLWTNTSVFTAHTTTSDTAVWDSASLGPGTTFSFLFGTAGSFPYHCTPHPDMRATVIVLATNTPSSNSPPHVFIASPTNGATFAAPASINIEATADDSDGTVTNVTFLDGTNVLGRDAASPFSLAVQLSSGSHTLTAVATDNAGTSTTSAAVTVSVGSAPITNPLTNRIPKGNIPIELEIFAAGLAAPIGLAAPRDASGRMFVYDQNGLIWIVLTNGARLGTPLLDVRNRLMPLGAYDERGLLGLAVHPDFANRPFIYTYTSEPNSGPADFPSVLNPGETNNHQSVLAEWRVDVANSNLVNVASRREILRIDKPQSNHNGGAMRFGQDGFLYLALGDGGAANDVAPGHLPGGNAQSLDTILGKMIRINVNGTNSANGNYGIPTDNPFVGHPGLDEIWAYGFRNPFSFVFDTNGTLYLGDVGQNNIEELDVVTKGGNFGWNVKEGTFWFDSATGNIVTEPTRTVPPGLIDPIAQYDHDDGLVILCGAVYRGSRVPTLTGRFVFGDWGSFNTPSGRLFYLDATNGINELIIGREDRALGEWIRGISEGPDGEIYVLTSRVLGPTGNTGKMLKIVPLPEPVVMTALTHSNEVDAAWNGGTGPFTLQKKAELAEPVWQNVAWSTSRHATAPTNTAAGFFRAFDTSSEHRIPFTAHLTGAAERPTTNDSTGVGLAMFALEGNALLFNIRYSGLRSAATAAHIHGPATADGATNVLIDLQPYHTGAFADSGIFSGIAMLTAEQRAGVLASRTYVNIHTTNHPGGEIRGQIAPVLMQVALSGAGETGGVDTSATGLGTLTLVHTQLTLNVTYRGLKSAATAAHIHGPAGAGANADVIVDLGPISGGFGSSGSLSGTVNLSPRQLGWLVDGLTYINFHTTNHPGGEIRGQILPHATAVPFTASLDGTSERPTPVATAGTGAGTFALEDNRLSFNLAFGGFTSMAMSAHIHGPAGTDQATNVLVDLEPFNGGSFTNGTLSGTVTLTPFQRNALLNGQSYVNVHTMDHSSGEIRGQIAPVLMLSSLSGVNERPASVDTPASGSGTLALVRNQLTMVTTYADLKSTATASHIHGPAGLFQSTNVLVDLAPLNGGAYGVSGALAGSVTLVNSNLLSVIAGQTYINFHTTNHPSGEIRGQIVP